MNKSKTPSIFYLILSIGIIYFTQEMFLTNIFNFFGQKGVAYKVSVENENGDSKLKYQYYNKYLNKEFKNVRTLSVNSLKEKFIGKNNITIYYTKQYPYYPKIDGLPDLTSIIVSIIGLTLGLFLLYISLKELFFTNRTSK